jgi:glycopeptide antibiotics resistance protein/uncharacterized RDD family membrane protein YckC
MYFLVILPLPPISEVKNYTSSYTQLEPFYAIMYLKNHLNFSIQDISTYKNLLENAYFYQLIYNVALTIPFGIYMRYYFKRNFKETLVYSFILSLFFELTQLSGLYGIYPRPYRIFDVDDLITNTLGGIIGYLATPLFSYFLPSRETVDEKAYLKGKNISTLRKLIAFVIDMIVINILLFITHNLFKNISILSTFLVQISILIFIYFILFSYLYKGRTIGKMILKIQIKQQQKEKLGIIHLCIREFTFWTSFIIISYTLKYILEVENQLVCNIIYIFVFILFFLYLKNDSANRPHLYEKISKTELISTIKRNVEKERTEIEKESEKNENIE